MNECGKVSLKGGRVQDVSVTINVPTHQNDHLDHLFLRYRRCDEPVRHPSFVESFFT